MACRGVAWRHPFTCPGADPGRRDSSVARLPGIPTLQTPVQFSSRSFWQVWEACRLRYSQLMPR